MKLIFQTLLMITSVAFASMFFLAKTEASGPAPKTAQNVCYGVYYANSPQLRCNQLSRKGEVSEKQQICTGIRAATSSRATCANVEGLAKVMCVGTAKAAAKNADCETLTENEKAVCLGTLYAQGCDDEGSCSQRSCKELKGLAQKVCWGVLHGTEFSCEDLSGN